MSRPCLIIFIYVIAPMVFITGLCIHARACTIWASAGDAAGGGGTIIAKNRDNVSSLYTGLKMVFPSGGFRFFGILDVRADWYVAAAINEKGLVVVNASANSVPARKRHTATEDVTERILTAFDSVDALLDQKGFFERTHPAIYLIADAKKIMSVEVAPGGRVSACVKENGTLAFTNHFTDERIIDANERMSRQSLLRLKGIKRLLDDPGRPHSLEGFISMSRDENGGSDGAVMRKAKKGSKIRTLATWIVRLEPGKSPELYTGLFNSDEKQRTYRVRLDDGFWNLVPRDNRQERSGAEGQRNAPIKHVLRSPGLRNNLLRAPDYDSRVKNP